MRATIGFRLIIVYATIATLTAFLTLWAGDMWVGRQMIRDSDELLDGEAKEIRMLLSAVQEPYSKESIALLLTDHTLVDASVFFFQVEDATGKTLFRSRNLAGAALEIDPEREFESTNLILPFRGPESRHSRIRVAQYEMGPFVTKIGVSLAAQEAVERQFHWIMLAAVPSVFIASLGVGYLLSIVMLGPLRAIQETAKRIGAHNLKERIPVPKSKDELSRLVELLNDTFDRIEKAFEQVRRFTADSSHELKTPLSIVRLHTEKLMDDEALSDKQRTALKEAMEELTRLEKVINQLLFLAKAESESFPLEKRPTEIASYMDQFREDAEILCESSERQFTMSRNQELNVSIDPSWIRQALFNLLSNAIKFSPEGGLIELSSEFADSGWRVSMTDQGPGAPADRLEKIFERFVTLGGRSEGSGLGLSVCRSIVERHDGQIWAELNPSGKGLRVIFEIPIQPTARAAMGPSAARV